MAVGEFEQHASPCPTSNIVQRNEPAAGGGTLGRSGTPSRCTPSPSRAWPRCPTGRLPARSPHAGKGEVVAGQDTPRSGAARVPSARAPAPRASHCRPADADAAWATHPEGPATALAHGSSDHQEARHLHQAHRRHGHEVQQQAGGRDAREHECLDWKEHHLDRCRRGERTATQVKGAATMPAGQTASPGRGRAPSVAPMAAPIRTAWSSASVAPNVSAYPTVERAQRLHCSHGAGGQRHALARAAREGRAPARPGTSPPSAWRARPTGRP